MWPEWALVNFAQEIQDQYFKSNTLASLWMEGGKMFFLSKYTTAVIDPFRETRWLNFFMPKIYPFQRKQLQISLHLST